MTKRELDIVIAEKVLGHSILRTDMGSNIPYMCRSGGIELPVPYYTLDMDSALEVLDHLKPFLPDIIWDKKSSKWFCLLLETSGIVYVFPGSESIAHAVCMTAAIVSGIKL